MAQTKRPLLARGEQLGHDLDRPQGGGPPYIPFSIGESEDILRPQVAAVRDAIEQLPEPLLGDQVFLELTMRPNFIANSHFPETLLRTMGASVVGTKYDTADYVRRKSTDSDVPTKTLILAGPIDGVDELSKLIDADASKETLPAKRNLTLLDGFRLASVADVPDVEDPEAVLQWDLVLHPEPAPGPRQLAAASAVTVSKLQTLADTVGVEVEDGHVTRLGGLTFVSVRATREQIAGLERFNPLRAAYPVLPAVNSDPSVADHDGLDLPDVVPAPPNALRIAIFDGGLQDPTSPVYHDRVTLVDHSALGPHPASQRHGMLVTSSALYGHAPVDLSAPNGVVVEHHRIWPYKTAAGDADMLWALDRIEAAVSGGDYDVVVIACAPAVFIEDDFIDRWTATLDQLAVDTSTLFVVAAGNFEPHQVSRRVQVPASAVNGLTVGSASNHAPKRVEAAQHSRTGPGRAGCRVAPSGLWFGGTSDERFSGFNDKGDSLTDLGSSFAAPAFAGSLASLHNLLGSRSRPDLWRAFAVHFASPGRPHDTESMGYGRLPADYKSFFECASHEVHVLYEAPIERGQTLAFDLPVPLETDHKLDIKYTVVYTSPVEPSNAVEYTQVGLEVQLRPHALRYQISNGGNRRGVHLDDDLALITDLIEEGWRLAPEPDTLSVPQSRQAESSLRLEGKWETVQHRKRGFRSGNLCRPRVDITHYSRQGGVLTTGTPPVDMVMLVSVSAKKGVDVYDAVRAQYPQLVSATASAAQTVSVTTSS